MFSTPILFLIFNRPDTTEKVFNEIRKQKPKYLFVAADGPRVDKPDDAEKCRKSRELVMNGIDWDCKFKTLFREKNLGCGLAVSSAITWFFEQVEEGIILEDDTLPDLSFFQFCKNLLEKYRHEDRIKMISGNNFQRGKWRGDGSYYFSKITHSWGWATWKRAWREYDFDLSSIDDRIFEDILKKNIEFAPFHDYWRNVYYQLRNGSYDTWDYQFLFSMWLYNGICIVPNKNLVTNIGFGNNATHTINTEDQAASLPLEQLDKIQHPVSIEIDKRAEKYLYNKFIGKKGLIERGVNKLISFFSLRIL